MYESGSLPTNLGGEGKRHGPKALVKPDPVKSSSGPSYRFISASAATTYPEARSVYVGSAGNVRLSGSDGIAVTFESVPAGTTLATRATWGSGSAGQVNFLY